MDEPVPLSPAVQRHDIQQMHRPDIELLRHRRRHDRLDIRPFEVKEKALRTCNTLSALFVPSQHILPLSRTNTLFNSRCCASKNTDPAAASASRQRRAACGTVGRGADMVLADGLPVAVQ